MPLDEHARRYADSLFTRKEEDEILPKRSERLSALKVEYDRRGLIASGAHAGAIVTVHIETATDILQARAESLLQAYETTKHPFDEQSFAEVISELEKVRDTEQRNAVLAVNQRFQGPILKSLALPSMDGEIEQGIAKAFASARRKVQIHHHEAVLKSRPPEVDIAELHAAQFAPALQLFQTARDAYLDQPRRDRDACSNMYDAMESAAKIVFNMPTATFGKVLDDAEKQHWIDADVLGVLRKIELTRHHHLGHGMTTSFNLSPAQVDFVYYACLAGLLLFVRMK